MPTEHFTDTELELRGKLDIDLYTVRDIVIRTGLGRDTIHTAIRQGRLRAKNFGGARGYMILHKDLMRFLGAEEE